MTLSIHPAAALFPPLDEGELQALADSIKSDGLNYPIVTDYEGKILLEGRNRLKACEMAGVKPHFVKLAKGKDPVDFILAANINRRHMTKGAMALIVAKIVIADYAKANCCDPQQLPWDKLRKRGPGGAMHQRARAAGISKTRLSRALDIAQFKPSYVDEIIAGLETFERVHHEAKWERYDRERRERVLTAVAAYAEAPSSQSRLGEMFNSFASFSPRHAGKKPAQAKPITPDIITDDAPEGIAAIDDQSLADYFNERSAADIVDLFVRAAMPTAKMREIAQGLNKAVKERRTVTQ
jgi:hypothetical protein